jgi:nitroreductase
LGKINFQFSVLNFQLATTTFKVMIDTKAFDKLIADRRSVYPKQYNGVPVDDSIVTQMLENANWAPTHGLTEPWRFVVFTGEALGRLANFFQAVYKETTPSENFDEGKYQKQRESILQSSHVVAIIMKRQETGKIPEIEEVCAVACAVQNIWLTATVYGVGCYWSTGGPTFKPQGKAYFGLGEQDKLLGFMYIGNYDGDLPVGRRKPIEQKSEWNR